MPLEPLTTAFVAANVFEGLGNLFGGRSSSNALERNADVARRNAEANARDILSIGGLNASITRGLAEANATGLRSVADFNARRTRESSEYNAEAIRRNSEYEAQVQEYNARIAGYNAASSVDNARLSREFAQFEAEQIRRDNRRVIGAQAAGFAKAGVVLDGTAYDVMYDSALEGYRDELIAIYSGDLVAHQFFTEATNFSNQEGFFNFNAEALRVQGEIESTYALWKGEVDAQALLLEGYTNASLIMAEGQLRSALTLHQADISANAAIREGQAASASLLSQAGATSSSSFWNAAASFAGAGAPFLPSIGGNPNANFIDYFNSTYVG